MRRVINGPFVAVVAMLLLALAGMQAVLWAYDVHLIKQGLNLRKGLYLLPEKIGAWQKVAEQQFSHDITDEMGTRHYALWTLQNADMPRTEPGAIVRLLIAYYSDVPDAMPDVQSHLYILGGQTGQEVQRVAIDTGDPAVTHANVLLVGDGARPPGILNLYLVNGVGAGNPAEVQRLITNVHNRYAYWCKVELMPGTLGSGGEFRGITRHEDVAAAAEPFLREFLPVLRSHLPEWTPEGDAR